MSKALIERVNTDYRKILQKAEKSEMPASRQMEKLNEAMVENKFTLKGKAFPTFLKPLFVPYKQREMIRTATRVIMNAAEKVADLYFKRPELQDMFEVPENERELVAIQPPYPRRLILARLDAFLDNGKLTFLEFNCDSPSGMGWHDILVKLVSNIPVIKELKKKYELHTDTLLDSFLKMLLKKYKQTGGKRKPTIAVVCNENSSIRNDVDLIIEHFRKRGYETLYADPRHFDYDGKYVRAHGKRVDIIHRDAIQDFTDYINDVQPILRAWRDGKICMINPFCSRVGGLKCVLYYMTHEDMQHLFTKEEAKVIRETIPWTRFMKEGKTIYRGAEIDLIPFVARNKEHFVLKPNSGYGGFGVAIGRECDQATWDSFIEKTATQKYVVQEFVEIPEDTFPIFDPGLKFESKKANINFFAFDGNFGGAFVRVSSSSIINIHQGGGLVQATYVKGRK